MSNIKSSKIIATLLAFVMALAFMSFTLTYASAEDPEPASSDAAASENQDNADTATKTAPTPEVKVIENTYGAPDLEVTIDFGTDTPKFDYAKWNETDNLKDLMDSIKVYTDKELTKEVTLSNKQLSDVKFENNKVTFTVLLSKASGLSATTTYYLSLGDALTETADVKGESAVFEFKTNPTTTAKTTTTTRTITTRTTYRTITTKATTVRAKSANTDDPSHLPLWIGVIVASAVFGGMAYIANKGKE